MLNKDKSLQQIRKLLHGSLIQGAPATVLSFEGDTFTCTAQFMGTDLVVSGVACFMMGTPERRIAVLPRIGSGIMVGVVNQKPTLTNLSTIWVMEPETQLLVTGTYVFLLRETGLSLEGPTGHDEVIGRAELLPAMLQNLLTGQTCPRP